MSPELYFAVMLITNPQKAKRILVAEDWENWFMDLFDEEFEDILDGLFLENQEMYIEKIIDKYLSTTRVNITDNDDYSKSVLDKAVKTATEIQDATLNNILLIGNSRSRKPSLGYVSEQSKKDTISAELVELIQSGIALTGLTIGGIAVSQLLKDKTKRWLGKERANLIALNEANWIFNNEEFFDAKDTKKTKTWHTALDEKVRETHVTLEGMTLPIDSYFQVGSCLMRYPQDWEKGTVQECLNCRCSLSYQ